MGNRVEVALVGHAYSDEIIQVYDQLLDLHRQSRDLAFQGKKYKQILAITSYFQIICLAMPSKKRIKYIHLISSNLVKLAFHSATGHKYL